MNIELKNNHCEVYDVETLSNLFSYVGLNIDTQEEITFVIHESRNDLEAFIKHLTTLKGMIGYNNLRFDYPIIHAIFKGECKTAEEVYKKAQEIIDTPEEDKFKTQIPEWHHIISQLDLYALNHFDNPAKRTSLKDLEFWMNYPNVQDMPISYKEAITATQIPMVLEYNLNDVKATYAFYKLCKEKIQLRKDIGKQYGLKMANYNDPRIGSEIFLDLLSKDMRIDKKELRKKRTFRKSIALRDIILPTISFESDNFKRLLGNIKSTEVVGTKNEFSNSIVYKGFKYDLGLGGIHGCIKSGVYESDDEYIIQDIDVVSFYPNIAINNNFKPAHLGESFCKIYKNIYEARAKAKKEGNKALNEGLKLSLNGCFGKAGDKNSYLYDPQFLLSITINGQLLLLMLIEEIVDTIDCQVLQVNTDGITIKYKQESENIVAQICKDWEQLTKFQLEYKNYSKMIIQDVNNYQAVDTKGNIKAKGLFEITKEYHKDTSFKIVPIALIEYFVNNTPIMETLTKHRNIYDFCGRAKFKRDSYGEIRFIVKLENGSFIEQRVKQQKTTRYYITTKGATFMKVYPEKKKESFINKGWQVRIFNKYVEQDYQIDYDFYYAECMKIIQTIENKQLQLL